MLSQLLKFTRGYSRVYFLLERPEGQRRERGSSFAIPDKVHNHMTNPPTVYSEKLIEIRITLRTNQHATLLSVYAFTMDGSDKEKNLFYGSLERPYKRHRKLIAFG